MSENWFDEDVAAAYDADSASMSDPAFLGPQLDLLETLARGRPALELGIGTGRVAVPLAMRDVSVVGIELSEAMVAGMRAKPGGDEASVPTVIGDMTTTRAPGAGSFGLVYVVFNSLANLTSQQAQVACFENAATHLAPGGRFVVELFVPALRRLPAGERYVVFDRTDRHIGIDEYDVATQRMWSHHVDIAPDGTVRRTSPPFRYAWPAELDLMARIANLQLESRWSDWTRAPFTADSSNHVSVWRKPEPGAWGAEANAGRPPSR